ncbi:MDR family MFS transporter [Paenibacillus sepulcri]|uniref:Multidrug efflux MFS transporter n=1 Tax=Paenibacillus sepulcri TaxID=359917 RepID=A0ABS7BZR8_9BACL|nr:multidrug efflux MFS transporter [Paenibacillus sepulcri]
MSNTVKAIIGPLVAIIVGMFMVLLNMTALNVAVPNLVETFNSSLPVVQWSITGYILAEAAIIPLAGWLSDRFGAKRMFLIAIVMFSITSILCVFAVNVEQFILFRVLQGLGGGIVMPIGMTMIFRISPPDKVGTVMAMMGVPVLIAPAIGPVLGGWLVEYASWQFIFWVNVPVGVLGIWIGLRYLPNLVQQVAPRLDILGMIFGPLAFAALVYGVNQGGDSGWTSYQTITGLSIGTAALLIFIMVELRLKEPLLELRVFRTYAFTSAIILLWITSIAFYGILFLNPVFLQQVKGYSAFDTGLLLLPQALVSVVFIQAGGRLFDRFGVKPLVIIGMAILSLGAYLLSNLSAEGNEWQMIVPLLLSGAGQALFGMSLNAYIMKVAPQELISRVTSLTSASQQVMGSFGIAGFATLLSSKLSENTGSGSLTQVSSISDAFSTTYIVVMVVTILGIILGFMMRKPEAKLPQNMK